MNISSPVSVPGSALLGVVESMHQARPLHHWNDRQKEAVRQRLASLLGGWHSEWIPAREEALAEPGIQVGESDSGTVPTSEGMVCWSFAGPSGQVASRSLEPFPSLDEGDKAAQAAIRAIATRMFTFDETVNSGATREPSRMALVVARAAWDDWLRRIQSGFPGFVMAAQGQPGTGGTGTSFSPWSGALHASWPWLGGSWHLELPHDAVTVLLGDVAETATRPRAGSQKLPRVRLDQALSGLPVALRVMLEGTELNLGQLQGLQVGDVVPLEHLLDAPARLVAADGAPVCHGWLGQRAGRIAVELAMLTSSTAVAEPLLNTHPSKGKTP